MTPVPEFLDPRVWAEQGNMLVAEVPMARMPRLVELQNFEHDQTVVNSPAPVMFELDFAFDQQGRPVVKGWVRAELQLQCQRCMQPVAYALHEQIEAHPVTRADMPTSSGNKHDAGQGWEDDFVYHENDQGEAGLAPLVLVEDELILALPLVAMHDDCDVAWQDPGLARLAEAENAHKEMNNPFAVLAGLRSASSSDEQAGQDGKQDEKLED